MFVAENVHRNAINIPNRLYFNPLRKSHEYGGAKKCTESPQTLGPSSPLYWNLQSCQVYL